MTSVQQDPNKNKSNKNKSNKNRNFINSLRNNNNKTLMFEPIANGAFGTVFHGIPNRENPTKNLKKTVNKVYYKKQTNKTIPAAYKKELARSEIVKGIIKSQESIAKKYGTRITKKQLLDHMQNGTRKNAFKNRNTRRNDEIVEMITMPNLGIDIFELVTQNYDVFGMIDKIAVEILKLLNVVYEINEGQKVHGDIRPENILVSINEESLGNMTIIDFDLFNSKEEILDIKHTLYHTPPEYIVFKYYYDTNRDVNDKFDRDIFMGMINHMTNNGYEDVINMSGNKENNIMNNVKKSLLEILGGDDINFYELSQLMDSIDLYGLGLSIKILLMKYDKKEHPVIQFIFQKLLPNIMNGKPNGNYNTNPFKRWSIQEAIDNYTAFLVPYCQTRNISIPEGYMLYQNKNIIP